MTATSRVNRGVVHSRRGPSPKSHVCARLISGNGSRVQCAAGHAMGVRPQAVQAQGDSKHADCAEAKVGAKPKKVRVWPRFQLDPAKRKSKKRQSKTNGDCSGKTKKPFVRNMTPQF